jgi:hypothetical protein
MLYLGLRPDVVSNFRSPSWACFVISAKNRKVVHALYISTQIYMHSDSKSGRTINNNNEWKRSVCMCVIDLVKQDIT